MNNDDDITNWFDLFDNSLNKNCQLKHSKNINISLIDKKNYLPFSEILEINQVNKSDNISNNQSIVCLLDNRTELYSILESSHISHLSIYFPLTQEKYLLMCTRVILSNTYVESYNILYNNIFTKEDGFIKYYKDLNSLSLDKQNKLNKYWKLLTNEDKLKYESLQPGTLKSENLKEDDLTRYEAQEEIQYNPNFSMIHFIPLDIDYTKFPAPQVVANSRKPEFESIYKPTKKTKRSYYKLDLNSYKWIVKELNP